jgi:acyl-CoA thioester hydrolase
VDTRDPRLTDPAFFDFWVDDTVRFSDQDAGGHINNTAIAQYAEGGRVGYLQTKLPDRETGGRFVAANLNINYLREEHYPGTIKTGTRVVRVGDKSITVGFGIFKDGAVIATGNATVAYLEGPETKSLPDQLRQILTVELR